MVQAHFLSHLVRSTYLLVQNECFHRLYAILVACFLNTTKSVLCKALIFSFLIQQKYIIFNLLI